MQTFTASQAKQNFGALLSQLAHGPVAISRHNKTVAVVMLPDTLTHAICRRFGVDPNRYAAPSASAQTLADSASSYSSEFQTHVGSRSPGVPLLVHR